MLDKNYLLHLEHRPKFYDEFMHDDIKDTIEHLETIIGKLKQIDAETSPQNIKNIMDHATKVVWEDNERIKDHFDDYMGSKHIWEVVNTIVSQVEENA